MVSDGGILALTAARPQSPQSQLPALSSPPHDDLIPREDACVSPKPRGDPLEQTEGMCTAQGGAGFLTQPRDSLGTWSQAWEAGPRKLLLGAQLLSDQQGAGHQATRARKICMRTSLLRIKEPRGPSAAVGSEAELGAHPPWPGPLSCCPTSLSAQVRPPQPCPQAPATQDPGLGLPRTQSALQAPPQGGMPGEGVLLSHPLTLLSSRLRGLL